MKQKNHQTVTPRVEKTKSDLVSLSFVVKVSASKMAHIAFWVTAIWVLVVCVLRALKNTGGPGARRLVGLDVSAFWGGKCLAAVWFGDFAHASDAFRHTCHFTYTSDTYIDTRSEYRCNPSEHYFQYVQHKHYKKILSNTM